MRHDLSHVRAERIRRHYLWAMIVSIGLFLVGLAVLVFAVPAYVQFISTPNP
jgi:hypothetical protein